LKKLFLPNFDFEMVRIEKPFMGCCSYVLKSFILIINGLLALAGLGVIGVGIWMYNWDTIALAGEEFAIIVLAFGGVILVLGIFGFLSAFKHWTCGLGMFAGLLGSIIVCEIVVVIYAFTNQEASESFLGARWEGLNEQSKEGFQEQFSCCGWDASMPGDNCPAGVDPDDYCWQFIKITVEADRRMAVYIGAGIVLLETIMLIFTISFRYEVKVARLSMTAQRFSEIL